ncbi:MAG: MBL fold metallo-hydrolase [Parvibaculum sp.]|nr:MBL fold metallo-hydrolase [Parvibaculum sp.]
MAVHGAAHTVTGSCYLLQVGDIKFLVDCGMFQGTKTLKELNYGAFPFDPHTINFVLLTHAHIDHSGLLPKLVKQGFDGPIHATQGTIDLLSCMLPDSGHIQEVEVEQLNRRNAHRGRATVTPIYTARDAEASLKNFKSVLYDNWFEPARGIRARYWNAGHILGSASIEVEIDMSGEKKGSLRLLFSGDVGSSAQMFHAAPDSPDNLDYVICEATYGGRVRAPLTPEMRREALSEEVCAALKKGGTLVMPAFAVERTQELVADLVEMISAKQIPDVPIFLDSPLAIRATEVFIDHADDLENGDDFRSAMLTTQLKMTVTADESMAIEQFSGNHIIVAASGMCDAGRIRHHLKNHLWRENSTILLTGFQAQGTLGRILADGARSVRIQGEEIKVQARIRQTDMYSGHADGPALLKWLANRGEVKRATFLVHAEEEGLAALHTELAAFRGNDERIIEPKLDDVFDLTADMPVLREQSVSRRLQPDNVGKFDWHNDLSKLWLDIAEELEKAADNKARNVVIRRLRRALENTSDK